MAEYTDRPLSVLVLADDPLALRGLEAVLTADPALAVHSAAAPAELTAPALATADLLLWDPGWDAEAASAPELRAAIAELIADGLPVVALLPDAPIEPSLQPMGLAGLLRRSAPAEQLLAGLHAVAAGLQVTDPAFAAAPPPSAPLGLAESLTPREEQVLALLAEGLTNRAIGLRLGISENTAKFHVQAVLGKLDVSSRTEAVVQATRLGLLRL